MKRLFLTLIAGYALAQSSHAAAIALSAGVLTDNNGVPLPDGTLVQVIASTSDASFSAPTPGSFIGSSADDAVILSFTLNSGTTGEPGAFSILTGQAPIAALNYSAGAYSGKTIAAGTPILLRWWPSKNLSTLAPTAGDRYGEYRTDLVLDGATRNWTIPPNGSTDNVSMLTAAIGGSSANTAGRATLTVVPEPSSAVLAVAGGMAMLVRRRRK